MNIYVRVCTICVYYIYRWYVFIYIYMNTYVHMLFVWPMAIQCSFIRNKYFMAIFT